MVSEGCGDVSGLGQAQDGDREVAQAQTSSSRDAVGTALSGGPPHRSQRAELPHWAPGSGPASDWAKPSPAHTIQRMGRTKSGPVSGARLSDPVPLARPPFR